MQGKTTVFNFKGYDLMNVSAIIPVGKTLRPYQEEAVNHALTDWYVNRKRATLLNLATGGGKTLCAAEVIKILYQAGRCLFVAHREELIAQAAARIEEHIGVKPGIEMGKRRSQACDRIVVASIQTLAKRKLPGDKFLLVIVDECFPAGTLVDNRRIETLRVGDTVNAFNETTGELEPREITRLFKNPIPCNMMRLTTEHHVLYCTPNHPIYTQRGWVAAKDLRNETDYLFYVRNFGVCSNPKSSGVQENRKSLLFKNLFCGLSITSIFNNYGSNQSQICQRTNDITKSNDKGGRENVGKRHSKGNETQTDYTRRQRQADDCSGRSSMFRTFWTWIRRTTCGPNKGREDKPRSYSWPLQDRLRKSRVEDCDRSRRGQPLCVSKTETRRKENQIPDRSRLVSVEILEQADFRGIPECYGDGFVYNFEVEGLHTYTANGVIVHNCHHSPAPTYKRVLDGIDAEYELHLSATPFRTDSLTLAARIDGGVYKAGLLDLIQAGYLADVKIHSVPVTVDMSKVRTLAGEFRMDDVAEALNRDGVLGKLADWVAENASNRRMLTFCPRINVSQHFTHLLRTRGLMAAHVDGKSPDRKELLEKFESGEITHLSNADLLLEGYDNPRADTLLMLRAVQSPIVFAQAVGRVTRKHPDKDYALLLDPLFQGAKKAQQAFGVEFGDDPRFKRIRLLMSVRGLSFKDAVAEDERLEQEAKLERLKTMEIPERTEGSEGEGGSSIEDQLTNASGNEEIVQNLADIIGGKKSREMRTEKQFYFLRARGIDASNMTKAQASRKIGRIKQAEIIASMGPVPPIYAPPAPPVTYVPDHRTTHPWLYVK